MEMENLHLIRDKATYDAYLAEYEHYFDTEPTPRTAAADRFELLGLLLARYEEDTFPIGDISPVEAIRFTMERRGYDQADLARLLGSRSRASEILSGGRALTLGQIRRLTNEWRIPADVLIASSSLKVA
jgi:antitoxin component HigA of HigAB toxin-antitoxin module